MCQKSWGTFDLLWHLWYLDTKTGSTWFFWRLISGKCLGESALMKLATWQMAGSFLLRENLKSFKPSISVLT